MSVPKLPDHSTPIERNGVYGDFKVVERLKPDLFRGECIRCGTSRRFRRDALPRQPEHDCPALVKSKAVPTIDEIADGLNTDDDETFSRFANEVEIINGLIEELETQGIQGDRKFQLVTLKTMVDLIPYAERQFRNDPRQSNAYSLNAIITSVRELFQDLQQEEERGLVAEKIVTKILHPLFLQIAQILVDDMYSLRRTVETKVKGADAQMLGNQFDQTLRGITTNYQNMFFDTKKRIMEELGDG